MYDPHQQEAAWGDREAAAVDHANLPRGDAPLTVDPRTGLRVIQLPAEELALCPGLKDSVVHFFEVASYSDGKTNTDAVFAITDQTCFLYDYKTAPKEPARKLQRCFNATDIQNNPPTAWGVHVSNDALTVAISVIDEYDTILQFKDVAARDAAIKALRLIYCRTTKEHIHVNVLNHPNIEASTFRLNLTRPKHFSANRIPQRTVEQLREALGAVKQQDDKVIELLSGLQEKMDAKHFPKLGELQFTTDSITTRLVDAEYNIRQNEAELIRLRSNIDIFREIIEPVDGVFGDGGTELPLSKDEHLMELEILVARLNAARRAAGGDPSTAGLSPEDEAFIQQLYVPTGDGGGDAAASVSVSGAGNAINVQQPQGSLWSQQKRLTKEIEACNKQIAEMRTAEQETRVLEARMKRIDERTAVLDHVMKTGEVPRLEQAPPSVARNLPTNYTQGLHQATPDIFRTDTLQTGGAWADSESVLYDKNKLEEGKEPFPFPSSASSKELWPPSYAGTQKDYKMRLTRLYEQYNPAKLPLVEEELRKARGFEEQHIRGVVAQYGPEGHYPPDPDTLRDDVARQMEFDWRQNPEIVRLREHIEELRQDVKEATAEAEQLKSVKDAHRCGVDAPQSGGGLLSKQSTYFPAGTGEYRPTARGAFFINVKPQTINCESEVKQVRIGPTVLVAGHNNGRVTLWTTSGGSTRKLRTLSGHTGRITSMHTTLSGGPGGYGELLTASADSTVRRWSLHNGAQTGVLGGHQGPVNALGREETRAITGGADAVVQVWDLAQDRSVATLRGHRSPINCLAFENDTLVSCEWGWSLFWDLRSGKIVRSLKDQEGGITCVGYHNGIAVAGALGGDLTVWDAGRGGGETITGAHGQEDIHCLQLHDSHAVTSGADGSIRMWDVRSMQSLGTFFNSSPIETTSFHFHEDRFVAAQGPFMRLWEK